MSSNNATRAALAVASGLAMGLAFPKFDHGLLAWVALVPLFYVIEGESMRRVFWWAYLQGFASYVVQLYWIPIPLHDFADVRMEFAIFPMLLLAGIVAIDTAVAIWAGEFIARRTRIPAVVTMPMAWTAVEWIRTYFPIGFPWNLLGYTAYHNLELIQFAEFTGVYGVSALIVFFNAVVYVVIFRRGGSRLQAVSLSALTALMIVLVAFGAWRIRDLKNAPSAGSFKVAMVQGNIPQSLKWDPNFLPQSYKVYQDETVDAAKRGADLIVWPEAAAAFLFQPDDRYPAMLTSDAPYRTTLLTLARNIGKPILFGAPALAVQNDRVAGFYNRANLVSDKGEVVAHYDKIELVPVRRVCSGARASRLLRQPGRRGLRRHDSRQGADAVRLQRCEARSFDLLREYLSRFHAARGQSGRRRAREYHQRRMVWREFGAVPGARDGGVALDRDQGPDGACGEHGIHRADRAFRPNHESHAAVQTRHDDRQRIVASGADALHDGRRFVRGDLRRADGDWIDRGMAMAAPGNARSRAGPTSEARRQRPTPLINTRLHDIICRRQDAGVRCDFQCSAT